ncbi:hypothetical protein BB561_005607 [Smittium simulii]|uniref:FAD/NAD(P)-binding domain-containing protein n=1 Tax=Smittium simulii TaxID=133385 RepID=A0A2T9Y9I6_9FUNG|nr:hypothetical protein BB561_005607 [Smittium simulii]
MKFDDQCAEFNPKKNSTNPGEQESLFDFLSRENSPNDSNQSSAKKGKNRFEKLFKFSKSNKPLQKSGSMIGSTYAPSINTYAPTINTSGSSYNVDQETDLASFKVVVIGGSVTGIYFSKMLESTCKKKVKITIIEPSANLYFKSASFSGIMDSTMAEYLFIPLSKVFKYSHNTIVKNSVVGVNQEYVETDDGKNIYYNALIIATGTTYPTPCSLSNPLSGGPEKIFIEYFQKIRASKSAVIVGGGSSGVELALRILKERAIENLTIIHDEPLLLNENYSESYRNKIQARIISQGAEVILNDKAKLKNEINYGYPLKGRWLASESGKMFFTDIQFDCTGPIMANSQFLKALNTSQNKIFDGEKKFVKVNRYLQIIGYDKIFAIGDVNNIDGIKCISRSRSQSNTVVETIKNWIENISENDEIRNIPPQIWGIDSNQAYISIKNNELDEEKPNKNYDPGLLNKSLVSKGNSEIELRKADDIKYYYKLLGLYLKYLGSF